MLNPICGKCGVEVKLVEGKLVVADEQLDARKKGIPFHCTECGALKFPIRAIRDVVYLWPDPVPESFTANSKLIIPANLRKHYKNDFGYVVSAGPGYHKAGKAFKPSEVKAGDRVVYDRSTPWKRSFFAGDGKEYEVRMMGALDIKAVVEEG